MSTVHVGSPAHGVCVSASLLGLLLWIILSSVSAARPLRYTLPTFLDTPTNITAYRGTDVLLPCAVHNLGPKSVSEVVWKKFNQVHPITIGEYVYDPDSSYAVDRPEKHESAEWNLRINDVQAKHAGTYECQITTKEDFTRNVTLTVIDSKPPFNPDYTYDGSKQYPEDTGIRLDGSQFVEKGMAIVLNCTATAIDYRPKGVDWFKDGNKLKSDSHTLITEYQSSENNILHSTLEILRSNMTDAGMYVCRSSKFHVASRKVIVLNTESSNKRRESEAVSETMEEKVAPNLYGSASSHRGMAATSVLLFYALLCWPLLRATVAHLSGQ
ncbi:uncharacterized protein LOC112554035 isoform X1 [Pomacea canaliculata]|uniref:uncharacterized protein LOC112554035 isoform X1 n=1 Tax=Pomacea canaliculata TaxID=400727 RepID=UPI000D731821|nr:uncharacterized protein LOC112554035 isoform X1 [Pomacea canaliculata]